MKVDILPENKDYDKHITKKIPSLGFCILMDLVGCISYVVPGMGELMDVVWAPISAFIFYRTFGGKTGMVGGIINFVEEALPGADIVPTFTIAWLVTYFNK